MVPETKMNGISGHCSRAMASADMPSKAGMEKSDRMMSGENSRSASENDSSVSTMRCVTRMPARLSSRTSSSASAATSSVRSTRTVGARVASSVGDTVKQHPVEAQFRNGVEECLELHRLDDVAVGAEAVGLDHVALLVGRGHHHHRDGARGGVALEAA